MEHLKKLDKNPAPDSNKLNLFLKEIDFPLDEEYVNFLKNNNGAEGFLNEKNYITLWNLEDLIALNPYYPDVPICSKYFFFGSDGSNLGYAFDKDNNEIISIDFLEIGIEGPQYISASFKSFIEELAAS